MCIRDSINVHETGAVESLGHKVLSVPHKDGKLDAGQVEQLYLAHINDDSFEHTVQPKMVYISNPTEYGTLYSRKEIEDLSSVCRKYGLYLFMDGARPVSYTHLTDTVCSGQNSAQNTADCGDDKHGF